MTKFTLDSVRQYKELGVFTQSGGIEVARTRERVEELKRRLASGKSWGVDAEILSPAEVKGLVPFIDEKIILGGFSTPGIGTVDSLRGGTLMREAAQQMGALQVFPNTEITGIDVRSWPRARCAHQTWEHSRGDRGDCVRHLEPAHRSYGGSAYPADAGRAPDDQRRSCPAICRHRRRNQIPHSARYGHQYV